MKHPLNKVIQTFEGSGIRRFFGMASQMKDVISLGVGEPDFETPWHIRERAIESIRKGQTFYTENSGLLELREGVAQFEKRHHNLEYDPKTEIMMTIGCSEAIDLAFRVMLDPGDEVIVVQPSYVSYIPSITLTGAKPVVLPLKEENKFRLTPQELENAITPKTKAVVISFPNNPTGAIMEENELRELAKVIKKHDIFVVSDEVYSELTYTDTPHFSIASVEGMKERTVVLNGFSKAFSMTGWRLGYAMAPEIIIQNMIKVRQYTTVAPTTFVQYAAIDAINDSDDDIEMMREAYNQRRRFLMNAFSKMGIACFEPEGAFYVFLNIKQFNMSSEEFCMRLLKDQKVAVVPGSAFGASGEGYVRISYAYSLDQLKKAMARLGEFIDAIRQENINS
ncbi:pyridoxal phosphate-dependent aminotransferase [Carnobacteriaceae bacterium zg-ZUI252]|nr:pyridoxal phosphate-dependent aminotransferase [Carnobacteriaceae bacterium zg-ZUI252]QTU82705.1 pyridoxal phosphate-dependent aminotransferase [Carnobacteriaceae bacterium zg-C25]